MPNRTIAIVDADLAFLEQMRELLEGAAYATMIFSRLEGTYDAMRASLPDAAIIGLHFPGGKHGIDLVTVLKLRQETRGLPVIVTSSDEPLLQVYGERLRDRAVPAVWTMPKPLDGAQVLRVLAQAIEQRESMKP